MIARRKKSFKAVLETNHFPTEFFRREDNATQDRIQSRAIATAGQHTNPRLHFDKSGIRAFFLNRQDGRRRPIGRKAASRAAQGPRPRRTCSCCRAAPGSSDADTPLSAALVSRLPARG